LLACSTDEKSGFAGARGGNYGGDALVEPVSEDCF